MPKRSTAAARGKSSVSADAWRSLATTRTTAGIAVRHDAPCRLRSGRSKGADTLGNPDGGAEPAKAGPSDHLDADQVARCVDEIGIGFTCPQLPSRPPLDTLGSSPVCRTAVTATMEDVCLSR